MLSLESADKLDHVLYLCKQNGRWGTIARSREAGLHGRKPVFRSLRDLVLTYVEPYVDFTGRLTGYGVGTLSDLGDYDWRFSRKNVWKVEERSEEHTSELQSQSNLVCRLLLEKKKKKT